MRTIIIAALLAAAASSTGYAGPDPSVRGIVESVREVQLAAVRAPGFPGPFEHALKPATGDELLVRLDDGRAIKVVQSGMQIFEPGQRVLVIPDRKGVRIEHAGEPLSHHQPSN